MSWLLRFAFDNILVFLILNTFFPSLSIMVSWLSENEKKSVKLLLVKTNSLHSRDKVCCCSKAACCSNIVHLTRKVGSFGLGEFNKNLKPGGTLRVIKLKTFLLQISGEHSKPLISVLIRFGTRVHGYLPWFSPIWEERIG